MSELVGAFDDAGGSTDEPAMIAAVAYYSVEEEPLFDFRFDDLFAVSTSRGASTACVRGAQGAKDVL
jgi:hypothetical protein